MAATTPHCNPLKFVSFGGTALHAVSAIAINSCLGNLSVANFVYNTPQGTRAVNFRDAVMRFIECLHLNYHKSLSF
jgi:hypothetical protein